MISDPPPAAPHPSSSPDPDRPHVMIVVGEPSGDALGGELMAALETLTEGRVRISGVGGETMAARGLESLFPISDTAVMGLREVIPAIPRVLRRVREVADYAMKARPDILVLIDAPDFTHRVARRLVKRAPHLKVVKYVAPQVWASRPGRAARLAEIVDCVLTLLPFEGSWFEKEGLSAKFVGHPVTERIGQIQGGAVFRTRHAIAPDTPLLAVLPGSRRNEVKLCMPLLRACVHRLRRRIPNLHVTIPVVPHVADLVEAEIRNWAVPVAAVGQDEKFAAFDAANAALAVSGTVTTEVALAGIPMVVVYRLGWLTEMVARHFVDVPFITLINLIEGVGVVPEFIQHTATPDGVLAELLPLLTGAPAAERQVRFQNHALKRLGLGGESPSIRAARAILDLIDGPPSRTKLTRGRKRRF